MPKPETAGGGQSTSNSAFAGLLSLLVTVDTVGVELLVTFDSGLPLLSSQAVIIDKQAIKAIYSSDHPLKLSHISLD